MKAPLPQRSRQAYPYVIEGISGQSSRSFVVRFTQPLGERVNNPCARPSASPPSDARPRRVIVYLLAADRKGIPPSGTPGKPDRSDPV